MDPFLSALIASGTVLAVVLIGDLGRHRITVWRVLRPLIAVAAVLAIFVRAFPHEGNDVALQLIGAAAGAVLGLVAGGMLRVRRDDDGPHTVGGSAYALLWIVVSLARLAFAYGSEHWFPEGIVRFCIQYQISGPNTFANTLVFMALTMVLARTATVLYRTGRRSDVEALAVS